MARPVNPLTPFLVRIHNGRGYKYGYVWRTKNDKNTGEAKRYQFIIGKIDENSKIFPNSDYRLLDIEERRKFIFPEELDISEFKKLNGVDFKPVVPPEITFVQADLSEHTKSNTDKGNLSKESDTPEAPFQETNEAENQPIYFENEDSNDELDEREYLDIHEAFDNHPYDSEQAQFNNRLYGNVWLLEQLCKKKGIYEDLLTAFNNDFGKVLDILSLAIYRIVEDRSFNRYKRWQQTHKILSNRNIYSGFITKFTSKITEKHRMLFIQCRLNRQPKNAKYSLDSTTRSAYGKCLVDVKWGHNKDDAHLKCTVEASVFSLTTHEPIYYRRFSGETNDMITVATIIQDLAGLGVPLEDVVFITDRGYCSLDNIARYVKNDCSFITCAKVNQEPVMDALLKVKYDPWGFPENMKYSPELDMYCAQFDAADFVTLQDDKTEFTVSGIKINLYCDSKKRTDEMRKIREEIKKEEEYVQNLKNDTASHPALEDLRKLLKFYQIRVCKKRNVKSKVNDDAKPKTSEEDDNLYLQYGDKKYSVVFNKEKSEKEYAKCGFFASCMYKMDVSAEEAYETYVSRDDQEKSFFELKNDIGADKQECWSEEGQTGRSFLFFVANILTSTAKHVWKESLSDDYDSYKDVLDTMESIRWIDFPDGAHMSCFTTEQMEICNAFGIDVPTECLPSSAKEALRKQLHTKSKGQTSKQVEANKEIC